MLDIKNKCIYEKDLYNLDLDEYLLPINYEDVCKKIDDYKSFAVEWVRKALEKPVENKQNEMINFYLTQEYFNKQIISLIANSSKIKRKYRKYKLLKLFAIGKAKKHCTQKYQEYKNMIKKIRKVKGK